MKKTDVLIVGAGPSGLFLAGLLSRCGIDFIIVDQNVHAVKESRALGIQARTLELFQNVDLSAPFIKAALRASGAAFFLKGKRRMAVDFADLGRDDTPFSALFFLPQSETEKFLLQDLQVRGVGVDRGQKLVRLKQNGENVQAYLQNGAGHETEISARYVVGCDGSHSQVRKQLGLEFVGEAYDSEFVMADAKVHWDLPYDRLQVFFTGDQIGVFFPIQGQGAGRVLTIRRYREGERRPETSETTAYPATLEEVASGFRKAAHREIRLSDPTWVTRYHVHHRGVEKMSVGRVFLAGDAAHIHSPLGAQGMNTGLQDVANLAWKLAMVLKQKAGPKLLETYHSERWPVAQNLLKFTDRLFSGVQSQNPLVIFLRNIIVPIFGAVMMNDRGGRRRIFKFISQLGIRYHDSDAVSGFEKAGVPPALRAGRRLPNADLEKGSLFDLVKGYQFHLLVVTSREILTEERSHLLKLWQDSGALPRGTKEIWLHSSPASGNILQRLGIEKEAVLLLRPDNYIAYRSENLEKAFAEKPSLWK